MGSSVEESVAWIAGLEALSWTHEARNAVDRSSAGQRRGQPGIQGKGVGHWTHASVDWGWTVEGKHGGVMKLHRACTHFFLSTPFSSAILKPDLEKKLNIISTYIKRMIVCYLCFSELKAVTL